MYAPNRDRGFRAVALSASLALAIDLIRSGNRSRWSPMRVGSAIVSTARSADTTDAVIVGAIRSARGARASTTSGWIHTADSSGFAASRLLIFCAFRRVECTG